MSDALDGEFSRSRAILIGTWDYHHLRPVAAAEHSLNRMREMLMSPVCGNWPESQISVVGNRETLGNLPHELVTSFKETTDVALFYYVGHGQYDNDDRLCLSVTDSSADPDLRTTTSLTFDAVRHALRTSKATTKIVILDCCFAGLAAGRDGTLAGTRAQELPRSPGFYLMMASGEFSTAWFQPATESPRPQTFFTKYLADVIARGIPDQPRGLTLGPIFDQVADALVRDGKPEPGCRVSDHAAHFVFARNVAAGGPTEVQETPKTITSPLAWNSPQARKTLWGPRVWRTILAGVSVAAVLVAGTFVLTSYRDTPDRSSPALPPSPNSSPTPSPMTASSPVTATSQSPPPPSSSEQTSSPSETQAPPVEIRLKNETTNMCASAPGSYADGPDQNSTLKQSKCGAAEVSQRWFYTKPRYDNENHHFRVMFSYIPPKGQGRDRCFDLPGFGSQPAGTKVDLADCNDTYDDNQLWWLDDHADRGSGHFLIHNVASDDLCLAVEDPQGKDAALVIKDCNDSSALWNLPPP